MSCNSQGESVSSRSISARGFPYYNYILNLQNIPAVTAKLSLYLNGYFLDVVPFLSLVCVVKIECTWDKLKQMHNLLHKINGKDL